MSTGDRPTRTDQASNAPVAATYATDQETFWAGEFGDDYISRNQSDVFFHRKVAVWARMLGSAHGVGSIMEFGCNIGLNLLAIHKLTPSVTLHAHEINATAAKRAAELGIASIHRGSILEPMKGEPVDLTFTSGVLIHIAPDQLDKVYTNLVRMSRRYVLVAEYYNPTPVTVPYRGHEDRLFKRDFAGDLIDGYGLKLVDYGFVYHRDNMAPLDDSTWFLLEK
ncbi:hypothetical protein GCM10011316_16780 [Roseibium aquae]|uniref:Pseudaminic acid biosynthesis-associated methylase n=1 Tax=Roseibium aquae TaxID=1323746 RepID=A0A916X128_9HYPH|nr:pseudaminic acid biosynthesis-associated methylase [Roseibium aquae]GGB45386.1 hypothetical protein GCM10011316_16780 [Roseibium aquae]